MITFVLLQLNHSLTLCYDVFGELGKKLVHNIY